MAQNTQESMPLPEWAQNAVIYEVNIRQYTPEGTFNAFTKHLPRLKDMGVDVLWLMPVFPIGVENRKGSQGSYYSISNYKEVNPKFGSKADFDALVKKAHELGMYIILDWVANHTSFDHVWTKNHPEWYNRDKNGNILVPADNEGKLTDWTDVADLNYSNAEMRREMIADMQYWVKSHQVDGFRCDVANFVPLDFWQNAVKEINSKNQLLMLAETDDPNFHNQAFHMSYYWKAHHLMTDIAKGKAKSAKLGTLITNDLKTFPSGSVRMLFIDNHDENSWHGTIKSRLGKGYKTFAVLTYTLPGMPLIYSGQENLLDKSLRFFEKDTINFGEYKDAGFYKKLNTLKHQQKALWNGSYGGSFKVLQTNAPDQVLAFHRKNESSEIMVLTNMSGRFRTIHFINKTAFKGGVYTDYNSGQKIVLHPSQKIDLGPWDYKIYIKQN